MTKQDLAKVAAYAAVFGLVGGVTFEGVNYTANHFIGSSGRKHRYAGKQIKNNNDFNRKQ